MNARPSRGIGRGRCIYSDFFEADAGSITAFVPVAGPARADGRVEAIELPAVELAVSVHHGSSAQVDRTYGALGTFVAERAFGVDGPIRAPTLGDIGGHH